MYGSDALRLSERRPVVEPAQEKHFSIRHLRCQWRQCGDRGDQLVVGARVGEDRDGRLRQGSATLGSS